MKEELKRIILSIDLIGLSPIPVPSADNPDNSFYYELEAMKMIKVKDTEENGIFAVELTEKGRILQAELMRK